jgi:hypothetical protein
VSSRARLGGGGTLGVVDEAPPHGVAEPTLESAERLPGRLAFGSFAVVVGTARAVGVADLGDGGHVQSVVEATVPPAG